MFSTLRPKPSGGPEWGGFASWPSVWAYMCSIHSNLKQLPFNNLVQFWIPTKIIMEPAQSGFAQRGWLKMRLSMTFWVCISIVELAGRGAAIYEAILTSSVSLRRFFISWHAPGSGSHWSSPWLGGCGHLWEDAGLPQTPVAGWEPQSPMGGLGRTATLPLDQRKGWFH